jgi:hypothetical protein
MAPPEALLFMETIFTLAASELSDHPLLAHIPMWPKDSEEFRSLRESLRSDGQLYEVLIDSDRRVVDGRNRRNALAALGQSVRCREVADTEVSTTIFRTLMQRRHLCKGARAFLAVPLVKPLIDGALARQIACQRRGDAPVSGSSGHRAPNIEQIALDVGVHRDTLDRARKLHDLLATAPAEIRTDVTARVIEGALELGYACTVLANHRDKLDRIQKLDRRQEHDRLFVGLWKKLPAHWEKATQAQREKLLEDVRSEAAGWPADLVDEVAAALRAAAKRAKEGAAA